ncbi:MAG: phosphoserine phosphatase SerB [Candidatus Nanopelagicales bacterium]
MDTPQTLLVTLTGHDRPGVTAGLFGALAGQPVEVLDVEQLVVRGRLVLAVLLDLGESDPVEVRRVVRRAAADLDMDVETVPGASEDDARRHARVHVTVLGAPLHPATVAVLADTIAARGGNIDRIRRVAAYPVTAIVLDCSGADPDDLRHALAVEATAQGVDVAVQRAGLGRRGQLLVVMDVDSTLIQDEVIDLLARHAGASEEVERITAAAMAGELDFTESLHARVALLEGLPESVLAQVREEIELTPGARTLCRTLNRLGYRVALVSGGFTQVIEPIAAELGVHALRANTLEVVDGRLTGRVVGEVVDRAGKRRALEHFAAEHGLPLSRTIAIGDGANDLDMLDAAGLGVAFNAKPMVASAADASVSVPYLDSVLYLLGVTREDVEAADRDDGLEPSAPPVR